jgi:hypothetical protein
MSRATFARVLRQALGQAPRQCLADWRPHRQLTRQPEFSGLAEDLFLLLEDQPAYLEVQLLGVGEEIDDAHRLIVSR